MHPRSLGIPRTRLLQPSHTTHAPATPSHPLRRLKHIIHRYFPIGPLNIRRIRNKHHAPPRRREKRVALQQVPQWPLRPLRHLDLGRLGLGLQGQEVRHDAQNVVAVPEAAGGIGCFGVSVLGGQREAADGVGD